MNYDNVTMTIDGEPFEVSDVAISFNVQVAELGEKIERLSNGVTTITGEMTVAIEMIHDFLMSLVRPRYGASVAALALRAIRGGRKGRNALRRLWTLGYTAVLEVDDILEGPPEPGVILVPTWARTKAGRLSRQVSQQQGKE